MKKIMKKALVLVICMLLTVGTMAEGFCPMEVYAASKKTKSKKVLVVYFSTTGTTKKVATRIKKMTGAAIFRIQTKQKYTSNYDRLLDIAEQEQAENVRPELKKRVKSMKKYDTIIIGYPIWWGDAPMAVYSFLESYDLSGKTILPFCTSGGTGVGASMAGIRSAAPGASVKAGITANSVGDKRLRKWLVKNKVMIPGSKDHV